MFRYAFLFVMVLAIMIYFIHKQQTAKPVSPKAIPKSIKQLQNPSEYDIDPEILTRAEQYPYTEEYDNEDDTQSSDYSSQNDVKLRRKLQYEREVEMNEYCELICQQLGCYSGVNDLKIRNNCHCIHMNSQLCNVYDNIL